MNEAFEKTQDLSIQIGYERGKRAIVAAINGLAAEAIERGEGAVTIDALMNVCLRELRK